MYTPQNEHFGIVPIEAMYSKRVVLACNSGGPLESILDKETGYLCEPTQEAFGEAMYSIIKTSKNDLNLMIRMGEAGRKHVIDRFSLDSFATDLDKVILEMTKGKEHTK